MTTENIFESMLKKNLHFNYHRFQIKHSLLQQRRHRQQRHAQQPQRQRHRQQRQRHQHQQHQHQRHRQ